MSVFPVFLCSLFIYLMLHDKYIVNSIQYLFLVPIPFPSKQVIPSLPSFPRWDAIADNVSSTLDSCTLMIRFPVMSPVHPRWFSSTVSNDTNMVTCVMANLGSKISIGPAMSLISLLSQDSSLSHSPDETSSLQASLLSFWRWACVHQARSATCLLTYLYLLPFSFTLF